MEDHNNYYLNRRENEENESEMLNAMTSREEDALLVDLVKGYPHIYDKELKDFKDIAKRNNSWKEIGEILNATASDCQIRWTRLRERYSREKKSREMETRSGSGSTTRPSFPLYEQMNYLSKFVKSRKSITNIPKLTQLHPIKKNEVTEKIGSSNISRNQIRTNNQDIINTSSKPILKTANASPTVASTNSPRHSAFYSLHHSVLPSNSDNLSQSNMAKELPKHDALIRPSPINSEPANITSIVQSLELCKPLYIDTENELLLTHSSSSFSSAELFDSDNDFSSPDSPDALTMCNNEISSLLEDSETLLKSKSVSPAKHSRPLPSKEIPSQLDRESVSPALSITSSSGMSSNPPKRFAKRMKRASSPDKIEESFLKLTSVVSSHLENKTQNVVSFDVTNEDDIFAKTVSCQLKKISEPKKSQVKGQIMKILYDL